ncbi:MAG: M23 family metallopeptidase [Balneolaceae bacterium]|nr:M23 family metallopeptidase [Balneolaceae bacterium]
MHIKIALLVCCTLFTGCDERELPTKKYNQFSYNRSHSYADNELRIDLTNPVMCPVRIWLNSSDDTIQTMFNKVNPIALEEGADSTIIFSNIERFDDEISYTIVYGSTFKKINRTRIKLPFAKNRAYRIIQGNNTDYTHNTDYSRYAIDFSLSVNDTISSATDGYVVGVIDQYKYGGKDKKWNPYGNSITIYDPHSGIFFQYVHLTHKGSFVKVGDKVKSGQPIGLSGETGQTDIEHLHFNSLIPVEDKDGLKSIPVEFIEGYKSIEMGKNDIVKK